MKTTIFHKINYDLKGHGRSLFSLYISLDIRVHFLRPCKSKTNNYRQNMRGKDLVPFLLQYIINA